MEKQEQCPRTRAGSHCENSSTSLLAVMDTPGFLQIAPGSSLGKAEQERQTGERISRDGDDVVKQKGSRRVRMEGLAKLSLSRGCRDVTPAGM